METRISLHLFAVVLFAATASPLRAQIVADGTTNTLSNVTNGFAGDVTVGTNGSFTLLVLSDNTLLTNRANVIIGRNAAANSNEVRLVSPSARWLMGGIFAFPDLYVGSNGAFNRLVVSNGATMQGAFLSYIGFQASSSNNLALVTGPGSTWYNGEFSLGSGGAGNQLIVTNGGLLWCDGSTIGQFPGSSNNLAVVTGSGSTWTNNIGLTVGLYGAGNQLLVSQGGQVGGGHGSLGANAAGSNNLALITGAGSAWSNTLDLEIGSFSANNQMIVSNTAAVFAAGNGSIGSATNANANSVIVTDPGTSWLIGTNLYVGSNGVASRLVVSNGAAVSVSGDSHIGYILASTGNVALVTGVGSVWSNANSLYVGSGSPGNRMVVSSGGLVQSLFGELGDFTGSDSNVAQVTDAGSVWDSTLLCVGLFGRGNRLFVTNGGFVRSELSSIGSQLSASGNEVVVTGAGSLWSNRLFLVGEAGSGNRLTITNAGAVFVVDTNSTSTAMFVGASSSATNSRVTVDGGTLRVIGTNGTGMLDVLFGTNVLNAGLIDVDQLVLTNTLGKFEFNGGMLITRGGVISNGLTFVVGRSGAIPAVWDVRAGVSNTFVQGDVMIGRATPFCQLIITNGATLTNMNSGLIGSVVGTFSNSVTLAGAGSRWASGNGLLVGDITAGNSLVVSNGATLFNGGFSGLGADPGSSNNTALVTGFGSSWTCPQNEVHAGMYGPGNQLLVSDGGSVGCSSGSVGYGVASSNNLAIVTGAGSAWTFRSNLYVGDLGAANQLVVSNSALVSASNAVYVGFDPASTRNRLIVDGGTLRVANATATGLLDIRRGTNVLNAGLIEADIVRMTNSPQSLLQFNGGTLSAKSSTIYSGTMLSLGNGVSPATMFLAGNGTHDFSGNLIVTISSNAVLTGNGTLFGNSFSIANGGALIPGSSIGKMIFSNLTTNNLLSLHGLTLMEISKNGATLTNDQVQVTGTLTYGGTLTVTNIGPTPLANGDRFQLFPAGGYAGAFTSIMLPPLGPGLTWKTNLIVDGSIEVSAPAAIPISSLSVGAGGGSYSQDFNSLATNGLPLWRDNSTLLGWYAAKSNPPPDFTFYFPNNGGDNGGGLYSFGSDGSSDRAFGGFPVNAIGDIAYGLGFTNDTATSVSNFTFTYTGEQWRNGGSHTNTLTFWYRVSPTAITNPEPSIFTNWTAVSALDFVSPTLVTPNAFALDGNVASNRHVFSAVAIPGLVVPPAQNVFFRWHDVNDSGNDQGMGLDDLTISFSTVPLQITSVIRNSNNGFVLLSGQGESNFTYGIDVASNLVAPVFWQRIGSNTADGAGLFQFTDTNAPPFSVRFYRAAFP